MIQSVMNKKNILSVYTQEENDTGNRTDSSATVNDSVKEVSEVNVRDIESDNGTSYIPEHSFLNEEVNSAKVERDENSGDAEDIIDHSFLADESALMDLLESSQDVDNESKETDNVTHKDSKELANKDAGAAMDSESGSESESDMEQESPDSSPVRRRKFERPESPENAEYDFIFSVNSLTDGKVGQFLNIRKTFNYL